MFYQNMEVKSPRKDLCGGSSKSLVQNTNWCTTNSFRIQTLSSNNPEYLINKTGYVVCENESKYALILVEVRFKTPAFNLLILSRKDHGPMVNCRLWKNVGVRGFVIILESDPPKSSNRMPQIEAFHP